MLAPWNLCWAHADPMAYPVLTYADPVLAPGTPPITVIKKYVSQGSLKKVDHTPLATKPAPHVRASTDDGGVFAARYKLIRVYTSLCWIRGVFWLGRWDPWDPKCWCWMRGVFWLGRWDPWDPWDPRCWWQNTSQIQNDCMNTSQIQIWAPFF